MDEPDDQVLDVKERADDFLGGAEHLQDGVDVVEELSNGNVRPAIGADIQLADDGAPAVQSGFEKDRVESVFAGKVEVAEVVQDDVSLRLHIELEFWNQGPILGFPEIYEAFDGIIANKSIILHLREQIRVGTRAHEQFEFTIDLGLCFWIDADGDAGLHYDAVEQLHSVVVTIPFHGALNASFLVIMSAPGDILLQRPTKGHNLQPGFPMTRLFQSPSAG